MRSNHPSGYSTAPPRLRAVEWLDARLSTRSPRAIAWIIVALWVVVVIADVTTGPQLALSLFYLAPIGIASWYLGWHAGLGMCAFGTIAWYTADLLTGLDVTTHAIRFWNTSIRASIFLIVTYSLAMLRYRISVEGDLARTDALTGLSNWRHFSELSTRELARAKRYGTPVTLAYLDLDNFKRVNDSMGHEAGDALLRDIGDVLRRGLRVTDIAARVGGDEFVIMFPDLDRDRAEHAVAKVNAGLQALCRRAPELGFSIGVVTATHPPQDVELLVRAADSLMYEVKAEGKGRVRFAAFAGPTVTAGGILEPWKKS